MSSEETLSSIEGTKQVVSSSSSSSSSIIVDVDVDVPTVIYALDFDGVLVDSANETAQSAIRAANILWPGALWIRRLQTDPLRQKKLMDQFRVVRPILYVGWEAILLVKLLAEEEEDYNEDEEVLAMTGSGASKKITTDDILRTFHSDLKDRIMTSCGLSAKDCNDALAQARNSWIGQHDNDDDDDGQDWISAHGFFEGACQAVRDYLTTYGNDRIYIITTKAKDFTIRLLERQNLYGNNGPTSIKESHLYGLGSGPKADVLRSIMDGRGTDIGVMVEDNIATLQTILASTAIQKKVLPVVASWGYNTNDDLDVARRDGYCILNELDSSSLSNVLDDSRVRRLFREFANKYHPG